MLYFSEIFDKPIVDNHGKLAGTLRDLIFLPIETPLITKFMMKTPKGERIILPISLLKKTPQRFTLMGDFSESDTMAENEASVRKNIQDKQILDLKGAKVIRANDVVIADTPAYAVSGIDVGILGVFRWIGAAQLLASLLRRFNIQYKSEFLPWSQIQSLEAGRGRLVLKHDKDKMEKIPPEDLADYLEHTSTVNALKVLKLMDTAQSAQVVADIQSGFKTELFQRFSAQKAGKIITLMDPDEAVDILLTMSKARRNMVLAFINDYKKKPIMYLLNHAKTPIGHLMTTQYMEASSDNTVAAVLGAYKKEAVSLSSLPYIYLTNKSSQLVGVVSLQDLLVQPADIAVYKIMTQNVVMARLTTPEEIALEKMRKYHLYGLPVVDDNRTILGIVLLEDVLNVVWQRLKSQS